MSGQDGAPRSAKRRKLRAESTDKEVEPNAEPKATLSASRNLRNGTTKRLRQGDPAYQNGDAVDTVGEVSKEEEGSKGVRTPRKGRNGKSAMTGQDGDVQMIDVGVDESIGLRSSDRQRKRPRRFSPEVEPTLNSRRGIPKTTTPRIKTPASVKQADEVGVSDAKIESIGKDLGFKDINGSSKKRQARRKATDNLEEEAILPLVTARIEEDTVQISDATEEVATPSKSKRKGRKPTSKQLPILEDLSEVTANLEELPVEEPELLDPAPIVEIAEPSIVREDVDDETVDAFDIIQKLVLAKLSGRRRTALIALDEEYKKVQHVAQQTVEAGEGNSMLIIGPRGSGKTTMIESVVSELMESQKDDFHIVRLSGFLQTDDRLALREIWRQLGREMDVEDDANKVSSYADTMASLLALLSHPEEHSDTLDADVTTKSIIFIIDEFDLFATHPRQTLLYNLFDIAQSRKAPIAVFGLSTKVDVAEHLEKRVKSRFSHRYVYLPLAKSLPMFTEMCMSALRVHDRDLEGDHSDVLIGAQTVWNSHVESLVSDPSIKSHIRREFTFTKSVPTILSSFILPFSQTAFLPNTLPSASSILSSSQSLLPPDSLLSALPHLPTLSLSLLIAAARLDVLLGTPQCNFNMVYHEYVALCSRSRLQSSALGAVASASATRIWGRDVARGCWEMLEDGGWIVPLGAEGKAGGEGREERMYRVDVRLEEIEGACGDTLGRMERNWCREL